MQGKCLCKKKMFKLRIYIPINQVLRLNSCRLGSSIPLLNFTWACRESHVTLHTCKVTLVGGKDAGHRTSVKFVFSSLNYQ